MRPPLPPPKSILSVTGGAGVWKFLPHVFFFTFADVTKFFRSSKVLVVAVCLAPLTQVGPCLVAFWPIKRLESTGWSMRETTGCSDEQINPQEK